MIPKKILIIRFSSIGDIVLTTPVIRCAKQQLPGTEIHFVTKESFRSILSENPYVDKLYTFKDKVEELYEILGAQKYDLVIDLHKNLRSFLLKRKLKTKAVSFNKLNVEKFLAVNFKTRGILPPLHIVDRYFETLKTLGLKNDNRGLDYFIGNQDEVLLESVFSVAEKVRFVALVVGGSYYTKKIPVEKLAEICGKIKLPLVLMGGKDDQDVVSQLKERFPEVIDACGKYSINQSASIIRQAEWVITSDTGLMHIASAYQKKIISIWGNTIPEFGMGPYLPNQENQILEVKNLECRPCSKLGYKKCPKGHFKCMRDIDMSFAESLS